MSSGKQNNVAVYKYDKYQTVMWQNSFPFVIPLVTVCVIQQHNLTYLTSRITIYRNPE
jgi:hypothetical protein